MLSTPLNPSSPVSGDLSECEPVDFQLLPEVVKVSLVVVPSLGAVLLFPAVGRANLSKNFYKKKKKKSTITFPDCNVAQ